MEKSIKDVYMRVAYTSVTLDGDKTPLDPNNHRWVEPILVFGRHGKQEIPLDTLWDETGTIREASIAVNRHGEMFRKLNNNKKVDYFPDLPYFNEIEKVALRVIDEGRHVEAIDTMAIGANGYDWELK